MKTRFSICVAVIATTICLGCSEYKAPTTDSFTEITETRSVEPEEKIDIHGGPTTIIKGGNDPKTLDLYEKVVVAVDNATVYSDPNTNAKSDKKASYFQILYSFGEKEANGHKYIAVGESFNRDSRIGFIDERDLVTWRHRVGYLPQYSPARANRILLYGSFEDAKTSLDGDEVNPIAEYVVTPERPSPNQPWLICDKKNLGDDKVAYKVYALGKLQPDEVKKGYTKEEIKNLGSAIRTLDVVFLIDGTGSMSDAIENVKSGVSQIARAIEDFKEQDGVDVKFGLVVYRDVCDETQKYEFNNLNDVDAFLKKISAIEATGGGDAPERGFIAARDALNETSWRPSSIRQMLIVGDARWHESGENNPDRIGIDQIVDLAKSVRVQVGVLAVNQNDLQVQLASLASRTDGEARLFEKVDVLASDLKQKLQKNLDESKLGGQVFDGFAEGQDVKTISANLGTTADKVYDVVRVLKTQGVEFERFKARLEAGETTVVDGWIVSDKSSDDLEVYLRDFEAEATKAMLLAFAGNPGTNCLDIYSKSMFLAFDARAQDYKYDEKTLKELNIVVEDSRFDYTQNLPCGFDSILRCTYDEFRSKNEKERSELLAACKEKYKIFDGYCNMSERWNVVNDRRTGWIPESAFP